MQYLKYNSYFFSLKVHIKQISSILSYMYKRKPQKGFFKWILIQKDFIAIWKLLNDALIVVWKVTTEHIMFVFSVKRREKLNVATYVSKETWERNKLISAKPKAKFPKHYVKIVHISTLVKKPADIMKYVRVLVDFPVFNGK